MQGGSFDDFLTHLMCCCCAMVQEWREIEVRGFEGVCNRLPFPQQLLNICIKGFILTFSANNALGFLCNPIYILSFMAKFLSLQAVKGER